MFGQSGLVATTVSPGSTRSWTTSWIALMPDAVTTMRSGPIGRPLIVLWYSAIAWRSSGTPRLGT